MQHRLKRPIRVLSLDGGGYRTLSSLLCLREVLSLSRNDTDEPIPRPCEVFDLIVGTSTGGLVALMLGRLGLSIEETIELFVSLGLEIFDQKKTHSRGSADVLEFERCMAEIAQGRETPLLQPTGDEARPSCSTAVTTTYSTLSGPRSVLVRSYPLISESTPMGHDWTMVEAARATSVAPYYFDPLHIGDFIFEDASSGREFNPAEVALREAHRLSKTDVWEGRLESGPIMMLSVGTGVASLILGGARTAEDLPNNRKLLAGFRNNLPPSPDDTNRRGLALKRAFRDAARTSSVTVNRVFYAYNEE
ncbi:hypothetical protein P7C70_g7314, partial [Phenoliferia sp. Uapishka_3]